ncbi:MAG: hypothetical protein WDN69_33685 [Aliidongia sp.]
MPRPGRWMLVLRQVLGLLLAGTAVWLIGVLVFEAGPLAAGVVGALALAAVLCLALRARFGSEMPRRSLGVAAACGSSLCWRAPRCWMPCTRPPARHPEQPECVPHGAADMVLAAPSGPWKTPRKDSET